jgi:poly-gamma-glutamate capsule biosynthesis protein CapA/YwtB (metallophosphatase superfamily)
MSTSSVAYHQSKKKRITISQLVVSYIASNPDETAGEIASVIAYQIDSVRPRFAELERQGIIKKTGERICEVTNHVCHTWALGGEKKAKLPSAYERGYIDGYEAALLSLSPSNPPEESVRV